MAAVVPGQFVFELEIASSEPSQLSPEALDNIQTQSSEVAVAGGMDATVLSQETRTVPTFPNEGVIIEAMPQR